ncbi:MAG: hypothetical protein IKG39_01465 [Lachnospiraceae bacterium]|nr:hypothetical protein [Lachnospiraceae bacterium]
MDKNNIKDIISLLDAGYSREEIAEMLNNRAPAEQPEEIPTEEPEKTPEPAGEPKDEKLDEYAEELKRLTDEVKTLKAQLQKKNIQQTEITPPKQETASDILARVINPNYGKFDNNGGKIK